MGRSEIDLAAALAVHVPELAVRSVRFVQSGYANDHWTAESSVGALFIKVRHEVVSNQNLVEIHRDAVSALRRADFQTPEVLHLAASCTELDGHPLEIQRLVAAEDGVDSIALMSDQQTDTFFAVFGQQVGVMHALPVPDRGYWIGHDDEPRASWPDAVYPGDAVRIISGRPDLIESRLVTLANRMISEGIDRLPPVAPRLVHRDLHLHNTLAQAGAYAGIVDLELIREWDPPWDFANRLSWVLHQHSDRASAFWAGYHQSAPAPDEVFRFKEWLYTGIHHVLSIAELAEGNPAWQTSPAALIRWLDTHPPAEQSPSPVRRRPGELRS